MERRNFLKLITAATIATPHLIEANNKLILPNTKSILSNDIYTKDLNILKSLRDRLKKIMYIVGHGNFSFLSYDVAISLAKSYPKIGAFPKEEIDLWHELFYEDPSTYGFYGKRTVENINQKINKRDINKIPYSGHYVFRGEPLNKYNKISRDIGKNIILTSGVRSVVKQTYLYINKIYKCKGNITQASYSLAPPGFSYHSIHDFDVGKKGWGYANFTKRFANTKEFKKLTKLDYISIRYTEGNKDGVRFEPWHVQV